MLRIGQKVIDKITGKECTVVIFNQTYMPCTEKTYYTVLIKDEKGNECIRDSRRLEII